MVVLPWRQPSRPKDWRTSDGESCRQPSSRNRLPATYQFNPVLLLAPPYSASPSRLPKLPPLTEMDPPGSVRPLLVVIDTAPPSVLSPNNGFDPGIKATSSMAIFGIRSHATTSPKGWFC